ncbi:gas vesicle protein [Streptomyces sp. t39]|uniref:gas vesicle protein n=1 Tax=Streptomyces sp. t39 TaxID=1828156 RepID=UPI0011CD53E1|nr:gas vesicle protein [Streptomyces sp. t39]TXS52963.1 gas vesicle protein [Streptomyces sp. t39]
MPERRAPAPPREPLPERQVALIDLLDRLLTGGVVITGDVVLSIADIDLVRVSLRALIVSIGPDTPSPWPASRPPEDRSDEDRSDEDRDDG